MKGVASAAAATPMSAGRGVMIADASRYANTRASSPIRSEASVSVTLNGGPN